MNEIEIRKQVLLGNSQKIRELLLTPNQLLLVSAIKKLGNWSSRELALTQDMSIQHASAKLRKLYNSGYLERREVEAESGGIEYVYFVGEITTLNTGILGTKARKVDSVK